ncbi:unnamed protein product [Schistosoma curassoni]|uniref:T9SS type A sorting domain-containing protein n=1 Tax=Schistosoma curassoni TaxID=6186 RepID=A0A183K9L4_9TREM|nr:unnamed protein product [Schistosoma curassoni]
MVSIEVFYLHKGNHQVHISFRHSLLHDVESKLTFLIKLHQGLYLIQAVSSELLIL